MSIERVKRLLKEEENVQLEFKEAVSALPDNLFETICAMLNRDGGDILLGVSNDGTVIGVDKSCVDKMVSNIVNLSNNPQKLDPPFILFPQVYELDGNSVIHIQVPASSQVHKTANVIYDRSSDGDFKVTQPQLIANNYNRKRTHYTENIVYPYLKFTDFKKELFPKIRNLIRSNNENHPWLPLSNKQLLEKAGLWRQDFQTMQEGYTLAAGLLLGKDEVIQSIMPHYKIDGLVRIVNTNRYDDRAYIHTNLIEAYELLMDFVAKHLPDKFYLQGDQRVSLRTKIFREVVANLIVHREYTNAHPCTFVIFKDRVETQNANNQHGQGFINPNNFAPFAKNPVIAKFFMQLGRVDELGSGVLNVNRYIKEYSGKSKPSFFEDAVFKMTIPIPEMNGREINEGISEGTNEGINEGTSEGTNKQENKQLSKILRAILKNEGQRIPFYAGKTRLSGKSVERYIKQLREAELIEFKGEALKIGGYFLTAKAKERLSKPDILPKKN